MNIRTILIATYIIGFGVFLYFIIRWIYAHHRFKEADLTSDKYRALKSMDRYSLCLSISALCLSVINLFISLLAKQ